MKANEPMTLDILQNVPIGLYQKLMSRATLGSTLSKCLGENMFVELVFDCADHLVYT